MKNFDQARKARAERDRSFRIGDEEFTYRPSVAPEALLRWSQMTGGEFALKDADGKPVLDKDGEAISLLTEQEAIQIYDDTIKAFLEPGQEEKWAKVRSEDIAIPLSVGDLTDLVKWLFEETSGRPTSQPSDSSSGSGSGGTGTTSKDESPLQAVPA